MTGLAAIESAFLDQVAPAPANYHSPDIPPLLVLTTYLTAMEGPLWKRVRGTQPRFSKHSPDKYQG